MRQFGHWTPRYIYDRLNQIAYQRKYPDAPWLGGSMIQVLESWLMPDDRGLEWGSGRSTIWFARRVKNLVSIEHNPEWYREVSARLNAAGLRNVEYHLCQDEGEYHRIAANYPPESFDFCLVDGVARDECALRAISLVKPGGLVIVDDFNRYLPTITRSPFSRTPEQGPETEQWAAYQIAVRGWRKILTTNGITDSGAWVKPGTQPTKTAKPSHESGPLKTIADPVLRYSSKENG